MIQDILKGLKDALAGFMVMALGYLAQGIPMGMKIAIIGAGALVAVLGVVSNVITKDFSPVTMWGKVAKDSILGIVTAAIPMIQGGANSGQAWAGILFGMGITALSVFSNVVSKDVTGESMISKILKDFAVAGSLALGTSFQATQGEPLSVVLSASGVALLTVVTNVIKSDFLGLQSTTAGGVNSPTATATRS